MYRIRKLVHRSHGNLSPILFTTHLATDYSADLCIMISGGVGVFDLRLGINSIRRDFSPFPEKQEPTENKYGEGYSSNCASYDRPQRRLGGLGGKSGRGERGDWREDFLFKAACEAANWRSEVRAP